LTTLEGVYWDLDGTIANTELEAHLPAFNNAFYDLGIDWNWDTNTYIKLLKINGGKNRIAYFAKSNNDNFSDDLILKIHETKQFYYLEIIKKNYVSLKTGVFRLINELHRKKVRQFIVTSSSRSQVNLLVEYLFNGFNPFEFIISSEDVELKKPNPFPYLKAIQLSGINKKNSIVISCNQNSQVENLITKKVKEVGAEIIWKDSISNSYELGLKGIFQKQNASVAVGAIEALNNLGFNIKKEHISEGLKKTSWKGRLEIINYLNKEILVDCAHNYPAAKALSHERSNWENEDKGIYWILGVQRQKDIYAILKTLLKKNDHLLLVPVPNQPSWQLKDLSQIKEIDLQKTIEFKTFELAIDYLFSLEKWPPNHPVLTGSIFLVAEFIKFTNKQKY